MQWDRLRPWSSHPPEAVACAARVGQDGELSGTEGWGRPAGLMTPGCVVLGSVPYRRGLALQERLADEVARGEHPGVLLLLEHPPTVTLGRRASAGDLRVAADRLDRLGVEVVRVGRGGGATVHAPGQLVGYPIVRLKAGGRAVRRFVDTLEGLLEEACLRLGIDAHRREGSPGLFAAGRKVASLGLEIRRGVVRHGFALNVDMDVSSFDWIVPCRTPGLQVTDLSRVAGRRIALADAVALVREAWTRRFAAPDSAVSTKGSGWISTP